MVTASAALVTILAIVSLILSLTGLFTVEQQDRAIIERQELI